MHPRADPGVDQGVDPEWGPVGESSTVIWWVESSALTEPDPTVCLLDG